MLFCSLVGFLKETSGGLKLAEFFHGLASSRRRANRITSLQNGETRLEDKEEIIMHMVDYFEVLHKREDWERLPLDNLEFVNIGGEKASWLERDFEEEEIRLAVFSKARDKAP